jgi:putative membrane protein
MKTFVLAVWSAFFIWLIVTGEVYRYIGPRTYWVVVFGAICLTLAAFSYGVLVMRSQHQRPTVGQSLGVSLLLIPVLLVALVPKPSLGSLAASRKLTGGATSALALQPSQLQPGEEVSFQQLSYAAESAEYASVLGLSDGLEVKLTGFVSDAETAVSGALALTRFSIFCCAADAVPYSVPIVTPNDESYPLDTWLTVEGTLLQQGGRWAVQASQIQQVDEPTNPYT